VSARVLMAGHCFSDDRCPAPILAVSNKSLVVSARSECCRRQVKASGDPDLARRLCRGVMVGESEPLRNWQVFLRPPR